MQAGFIGRIRKSWYGPRIEFPVRSVEKECEAVCIHDHIGQIPEGGVFTRRLAGNPVKLWFDQHDEIEMTGSVMPADGPLARDADRQALGKGACSYNSGG